MKRNAFKNFNKFLKEQELYDIVKEKVQEIKDKSESSINIEIIELLKYNNIFFWRSQVYKGAVKSGAWLDTGRVGLSDFTCMLKNCHLYIETKTLTGDHLLVQQAFMWMCRTMGHEYLLARSVFDVERKLKELGVI